MLVEKEASKQGIKKASEESRKVKKQGIKQAKNQASKQAGKQADRFIVTYKNPHQITVSRKHNNFGHCIYHKMRLDFRKKTKFN